MARLVLLSYCLCLLFDRFCLGDFFWFCLWFFNEAKSCIFNHFFLLFVSFELNVLWPWKSSCDFSESFACFFLSTEFSFFNSDFDSWLFDSYCLFMFFVALQVNFHNSSHALIITMKWWFGVASLTVPLLKLCFHLSHCHVDLLSDRRGSIPISEFPHPMPFFLLIILMLPEPSKYLRNTFELLLLAFLQAGKISLIIEHNVLYVQIYWHSLLDMNFMC